jgi:hypothetical protein
LIFHSGLVLKDASASRIGCSVGLRRNCTANKWSQSCSKTSQFFTEDKKEERERREREEQRGEKMSNVIIEVDVIL